MDLKYTLYVKKYKTFERKNGRIGQEIVVRNPDGYSCSIKALDKENIDLSGIPTGKEVTLVLEPDFTVIKGERYYQNLLTMIVVDYDDITLS